MIAKTEEKINRKLRVLGLGKRTPSPLPEVWWYLNAVWHEEWSGNLPLCSGTGGREKKRYTSPGRSLEALISRLEAVMAGISQQVELILVDDGSSATAGVDLCRCHEFPEGKRNSPEQEFWPAPCHSCRSGLFPGEVDGWSWMPTYRDFSRRKSPIY